MSFYKSSLLAVVGASTLVPTTAAQAAKPKNTDSRPNVIIMLADDMGYDDMSLRGNTCISTPNLDAFAQRSVSFENFYVHSVSAPTRASLLTGRHFLRTGISGVHAGRDFMNLDEVTIAEAFQEAGYATGMWGKWHSGKSDGYFPWERGFDEAYMAGLYQYENNKGLLNGKEVVQEGWVDANIADMAIDFIKDNKKQPFFAYVPFLSPHGIWKAPEEYVARKMEQGQSRTFATLTGMVEHLDDQIGRVIEAVEKAGVLDNTIIIFLCDNGPIRSGGKGKLTDEEWALRNPSQYRGNKGQNFENGIHSPLFVYWKGHYEGAVNESLLAVYDLYPTLCDIAGVEIPSRGKELDGISFKNVLEDPTITATDRSIYISQWSPFFVWHDSSDNQQAIPLSPERRASIDPTLQMIGVRNGDYKMLYNMWGEDTLALWNIAQDYKESKNLYSKGSAQDKELTTQMRNEVVEWYEKVLAEGDSHQMPTFVLGATPINGKAQIFCYSPIEISEDLKNTNHYIDGFNRVGQRAQYKVDVQQDGVYGLGIRAKSPFNGEATFRIFTNIDDDCGEVTINKKTTTFTPLTLDSKVTYIGIELISPSSDGEDIQLVTLDILRKK